MELALNLGWALLAFWMFWAWARVAPCRPGDRRIQIMALAMVILILLPAISMTDDLVAAQNPAEFDCCVRRDHDHRAGAHCVTPAVASLPATGFTGNSFAYVAFAALSSLPSPSVENPSMTSIQNRPPPAA